MSEMICPCCGQYIDVSEIRADAIEEVIGLARTEIDFESQAEQKRFVEFMEQLKSQKT